MADDHCSVHIIGTLEDDPELRFQKFDDGEKAKCTLTILEERFGGKVVKHYVAVWGALGESAAQHFNEGDRIEITGRLTNMKREKEGVEYWTAGVSANFVESPGGRKEERVEDVQTQESPHTSGIPF